MPGVQIQMWKSKSYGQVGADATGSLEGQPGHSPWIWGWLSNAHPLTRHELGSLGSRGAGTLLPA